MWGRLDKHTAISDGVVVEYLGYNYGARYQTGSKFLVVPAEMGSDITEGVVKLGLWWDPNTKWSTGERVEESEAAVILDATREALQSLGFRVSVSPVGSETLLDNPPSWLPWRQRLRLKWLRWKKRR